VERNGLEQYMQLRRHYLPGRPDTTENLAAALWLDNRYWQNMKTTIANGIALAFNGS
jgi:hypothetical protein